MNPIYDNNIKFLKTHHANVAFNLERETESVPLFEIEISAAHTTWRAMGLTGIFAHGSQLGLDTIVPDKKLYFLYGLGDGDYLRRILKHIGESHLVVFEPSLVFIKSILQKTDFRDVFSDPRFFLIAGANETRFLAELQNCFETQALRYYASGNFGNLVTPGTEKIPASQDKFVKFAESVPIAIRNYTNSIRACSTEDNFRGFINAVKNVSFFPSHRPISRFAGLLSDVPCVLVGTGPSLKASIEILKQVQHKVAIMACDSALNILKREGIEPHFVACLERVPWQCEVMTDLPQDLKPILVAPSIIHPDVFKNYPGRKIAIHREAGPDDWLFPEEPRYFLGSFVSHAGLAALGAMGCRDVYFLGMDSAYGPSAPDANGKHQTYYEGATGAMINNIAGQDLAWEGALFDIQGYDGTMRRTTYYWYRATFHHEQIAKQHGMQVKNVMPLTHGIPIPGTTRIDPEDFLKQTNACNPTDLWKGIDKAWSQATPHHFNAAEKMAHTRNFLKKLCEDSLSEIDRIGQFWFDNDPVIPRFIPSFQKFFASIEQQRYTLMTDSNGLFQKIMVPLILNEHALMEHSLNRAYSEESVPYKRINRQIQLYLDWYKNLLYWGGRLNSLINRRE